MNRSTISPFHVLASFLILVTQISSRPLSGQETVVRHPPVASQQATVRASEPASALAFQSPVYYQSGAISESTYVSLADLNGNGKLDILLADSIANDVSVLTGNGNGTFQTPFVFSSGGTLPATVVPIDLNGDGIPDLVVANQTCCSGDATVAVFLGNGDGTFRQPAVYDAGGLGFVNNGLGPAEIAVVDVNGDEKPDIVVATCGASTATTCGSSDGFIGVLLGNGDGTFQPAISQDEGSPGGAGIAVADVNGDGKPDILVTTPICLSSTACPAGGVSVMLGDGTGKFQKGVVYSTGAWAAGGIAIADLNGDGRPDVVVGGCAASNCWAASGTLSVLLGRGDGTFEPAVVYDTPPLPDGVAIADVNLDGKLDVVTPNVLSIPSIVILLGNGDGTLQPPVIFPVESSGYSVAIGDLNGDGKPDIVFADLSGDVGVLINKTSSSPFPTTTTLASSLNPSTYGQKIKLTAKVTTSSGAVPTGRVLFTYGIYTIGSPKLNSSGVATLALSTLNSDTFPLTAVYMGDTNDPGSTSPILNQVVNEATSSAALTSAPNPSNVGQAVNFTATITSPTAKPAGPVTFTAGKTTLGTIELSSGTATFTTSSLPAGSTTVTATFAGDSDVKGSSTSVTQGVRQTTGAPTTTSLVYSVNNSTLTETLTATVTASGGTPTGTVTFAVGNTVLGTPALKNGMATLSVPTLTVGSNTVNATYVGNSQFASSTTWITQTFVMPVTGQLYLQQEGGSAAATTTFGTGTSPSNFFAYYTGLPNNPNPSGQLLVGAFTAGTLVNFGMYTTWGSESGWAFSTGTDQASLVSFADLSNALGMDHGITQQTSSTTWLLHLDDALSYLVDDDNNDVLMELIVVPQSSSTAATPKPSGARPSVQRRAGNVR